MDLLTYEELRTIEREEREKNSLLNLGEDFIERFEMYIQDKQKVLDKSDENLIASRIKERVKIELESAKNSFKRIFEFRAKKIFNQALIDLRMGTSPNYINLLDFEKEYYNSIRQTLKVFFDKLLKRKLKKEDKTQEIKDNNILVRFIKEVPKFIWENQIYGPFKPEDIANLPEDIVNLLLKKKAIMVVNDDDKK